MTWLEPESVPDAGAFLARLVKLDPAALVRLRPAGPAALALWARLPFEVLVTRGVRAGFAEDATVRAADLLAALRAGAGVGDLPVRRDAQWRWPVPAGPGRVVERLPAAELRALDAAAATTLRAAVTGGVGGRAVGERVLREALLDHVPVVVVTDHGERVEVTQRMVQAVVRMGFLGPATADAGRVGGAVARPDGDVEVRVAGRWVGLAAPFGTAWSRQSTELDVLRSDERRVTSA
jgi:hypothetical protein